MERITIGNRHEKQKSRLKKIILGGLEKEEFGLLKQAYSTSTPISIYYNSSSETIAVYKCGIGDDELIFLDRKKPDKMKILINEIRGYKSNHYLEIAETLESIADGSFFETTPPVTFL